MSLKVTGRPSRTLAGSSVNDGLGHDLVAVAKYVPGIVVVVPP